MGAKTHACIEDSKEDRQRHEQSRPIHGSRRKSIGTCVPALPALVIDPPFWDILLFSNRLFILIVSAACHLFTIQLTPLHY